jgi:hypothetical protein
MKIKILSALLLALTLNSCSDDPVDPGTDNTTTYYGSAVKVGDDSARSYVKVDASGNPTAIGIAIPHAAMMNIPEQTPFGSSFLLPIPNQGNSKLPFKHITFDYNPHGHDPKPTFEVEHFDAHFYTITETEKLAIQLQNQGDTAKMYKDPISTDIPAGYTGYVTIPGGGPRIPVGGVPMMGWHFSDSTQPVTVFDHVMIYGFYNAKMNFMEPMVTKAFLDSHTDVTRNIPQPQTYLNAGNFWPTKYRIYYNSATQTHFIEMNTMVQH